MEKTNCCRQPDCIPQSCYGTEEQPWHRCDGMLRQPGMNCESKLPSTGRKGNNPLRREKQKLRGFSAAGPSLSHNYKQHALFSVLCCRHKNVRSRSFQNKQQPGEPGRSLLSDSTKPWYPALTARPCSSVSNELTETGGSFPLLIFL